LIIVVIPTPFEMSLRKPNSVSFGPLALRKYPARFGFLDDDHGWLVFRLRDDAPKSFDRERNVRKRGRSVAIAAAVIPIPGSTVLQMATSVVE
jgi:hypothetical protein